MQALIFMGLLGASILALLAALAFLYRYLVRSRLFPQLPRLWRGDKSRFFGFSGLFVILLGAFVFLALYVQPGPTPPKPTAKPPSDRPQGPSFDGRPPPVVATRPAAPPAAGPAQTQAPAATQPGAAPAPGAGPAGPAPAAPAAAPGAAVKTGVQGTQPPAAVSPQTAPVTTGAPQASPETSSTTTTTSTSSTTTTTTTTQPPPPKPRAAPAPKKSAAKMPYSICAASFADQKAARAHAAQLGQKGIKAWVAAVDLKKKGRWYRVYVGRYASFDQARQQLAQMRKKGLGASPFVTRVP